MQDIILKGHLNVKHLIVPIVLWASVAIGFCYVACNSFNQSHLHILFYVDYLVS